MVATAFAIFHS